MTHDPIYTESPPRGSSVAIRLLPFWYPLNLFSCLLNYQLYHCPSDPPDIRIAHLSTRKGNPYEFLTMSQSPTQPGEFEPYLGDDRVYTLPNTPGSNHQHGEGPAMSEVNRQPTIDEILGTQAEDPPVVPPLQHPTPSPLPSVTAGRGRYSRVPSSAPRRTPTPSVASWDNLGQDGQNWPNRSEELQRLLEWAKGAKDMEQLRVLRQAKEAYEQGNTAPLAMLEFDRDRNVILRGGSSRATLPRPEPPHVYSKKNRADYNMWERDCEGYFIRAPHDFVSDRLKVDFGLMYVSEVLKTLWRTYCQQKVREDINWSPTWDGFKGRMLDALGSLAERQQVAYEALRRCKQRYSQTPTELLNYLRPYWDELGETAERRHVMEYTAALLQEIQDDLSLLPRSQRDTLVLVEEQANAIYRRKHYASHSKEPKEEKSQDRKRPKGSDQGEGESKTPKKAKTQPKGGVGGKGTQFGAKRAPPDSPDAICFNCGEKGHIRPNCPKLDDEEKKKFRRPWMGKEKGQLSN